MQDAIAAERVRIRREDDAETAAEKKATISEWFKSNMLGHVLVMLLGAMLGGISTYFSIQDTVRNHEARLVKIESTYVPRPEHESKDKVTDAKFQAILNSLGDINARLSMIESSLLSQRQH